MATIDVIRMLPSLSSEDIEKFNEKINKDTGSDCWLWTGSKLADQSRKYGSYGTFYTHGASYLAHRLAYFIATGVDPGKLLVCHSCDVRGCVKPGHLWLGSEQQNVLDRVRKGRNGKNGTFGEKSGHSKLTEEQVLEVRKLRAMGVPASSLSILLGVTNGTIYGIAKGRAWKHLP